MGQLWCGATVFAVVVGLSASRVMARARRPYARLRAVVVAMATLIGCCAWGPAFAGLGNKAGLPKEVAFFFVPFGVVLAALTGAFLTEVVAPWVVSERRGVGYKETEDDCKY